MVKCTIEKLVEDALNFSHFACYFFLAFWAEIKGNLSFT